jgi:hypothetical protein
MTAFRLPFALRPAAVLCAALLTVSQAPASQPAGGGIGSVLKSSPSSGPRIEVPQKAASANRNRDGKTDPPPSAAGTRDKR